MNPLQMERDRALSRRLEIHGFDIAAIRLGIEVLGKSLLQGEPSLLVMQTLVSRAIADHISRFGNLQEGDLPELALQALATKANDPLLHACAMLVGSYSQQNAERVEERIFGYYHLLLTAEASELWARVRQGANVSMKEAATACGLKKWANHPEAKQHSLYGHCRRVHANPDKDTVIAMAMGLVSLSSVQQYSSTRSAIVRAATWGNKPEVLLQAIGEHFGVYREDVLQLLTGEALSKESSHRNEWLKEMESTPQGVLGLTDILISRFASMEEKEKAEIAERIFATKSCPWLWARWDELFQALPLCESVAEWVAGWGEMSTNSGYSSNSIPPHELAKSELGYMPYLEVVDKLPAAQQAKLAARWGRPYQNYKFQTGEFARLIAVNPAAFLPMVRPLVESGEGSVQLTAAILATLSDEEAAKLFLVWACRPPEHIDTCNDGDETLLINLLSRLNLSLVGRLRNKDKWFYHLIRGGYQLKPEDMSIIDPGEDLGQDGEYTANIIWDNDHNAKMFLEHSWERRDIWKVLRSLMASCRHFAEDGSEVTQEWLESILTPALLKSNKLMRQFCSDAWFSWPGSRYARAMLSKDSRVKGWMNDAEREEMADFIRANAHDMLVYEPLTLRAFCSRSELVELFCKGCVGREGRLCDLEPWLDLFESKVEKDRLVEITAARLQGESVYDALKWVGIAGLRQFPAIKHRLEAMLDMEGESYLVECAAKLLKSES